MFIYLNAEPETGCRVGRAACGTFGLPASDLDGNQLFFIDPSEATSPKIAGDEATG
jgi:hypothetical protein